MNEELAQLEAELKEVQTCELEYLPDYGYSSKAEIIAEIEADLKEVKAEISTNDFDYTDEELEYERTQLCCSLGISRYC
nr:MAG TPA: hypothetical protein [Caudoviricetes sp.]